MLQEGTSTEALQGLQPEEVLQRLGSTLAGLSVAEVARRQEQVGRNELPAAARPSRLRQFADQFASPLIIVLVVAAIFLVLQGESVDAGLVLAVLLANAAIGVIQEGRAQHSLDALARFTNAVASVRRGGSEQQLSEHELVPGDIVLLREGDRVPADLVLLEVAGLTVDESLLTGESEPVRKLTEPPKVQQVGMFQQGNRAYQGTLVRTGTAIGVVVATGTRTELGKINAELKQPEPEIPLHRHIATLAKQILGIAFVLGILLMAVGLHRGEPVGELVATAVALAISVVPEGLPIVLTYVLATGVTRMSQRQVLVKKLQAVESLGQAQILAVDKTGTITRNELAVTRIWLAGKQYDVEADGFHPHGAVTHKGKKGAALLHHLSWVARSSALTATAKITAQDDGTWDVAGEPTEAALSVFAQKTGVVREEIETYYELLEDTGFDYTSKVRLVLHKFHKQYLVTVAGAPEAIAEVADLTADEREAFLQAQQQMAQEGLRTVAVAHQVFSRKPQLQLAHHRFRLDGLLGMRDTLRPGVSEAVAALAATGIKVVMITGDHAATAEALARTADIFHDGDHVMTGVELERLSEGELAEAVKNVTVFARVTPEHKLRIVQAFRAAGKTIAMTGDGVNDAPSLVAADLGISMGQRGTDVAKEASDLVLLDDNMGSIVAAVEEGRAIYARIQRVVRYLLTGSMSQVLLISLALFFVLPLPLLPSQIIWLNMVTDAFMVLGVAQDRDRAGLLGKDYVHPRTILTAAMLRQVLTLGVPIALGTLAAYLVALQGGDIVVARTVALTTLATAHWLAAWLIGGGVTSNRTLAGLTVVALGLQLAVLYLEPLQRLFHTAPLAAGHWLLIGGVLVVIWAVEMVRRLLHKLVG